MVGHGGSSACSYLADPTSPIPSHCASIVATSTLRVKTLLSCCWWTHYLTVIHPSSWLLSVSPKRGFAVLDSLTHTEVLLYWTHWPTQRFCYIGSTDPHTGFAILDPLTHTEVLLYLTHWPTQGFCCNKILESSLHLGLTLQVVSFITCWKNAVPIWHKGVSLYIG